MGGIGTFIQCNIFTKKNRIWINTFCCRSCRAECQLNNTQNRCMEYKKKLVLWYHQSDDMQLSHLNKEYIALNGHCHHHSNNKKLSYFKKEYNAKNETMSPSLE